MKSVDDIIKSYMEQVEASVQPTYDDARTMVLDQMKQKQPSFMWIGVGVLAALVVTLFLVLNTAPQVVRVQAIAHNVEADTDVTAIEGVEAPDVVLLPDETNRISEARTVKQGRTEPIKFQVQPNTEEVDKLIQDYVAVANAASGRNDSEAAARAYYELARTLELHDRTEQVQWAANEALKFVPEASTGLKADIKSLIQKYQK
ncbi:MAG: hypothetical protein D8M52_00740 [Chlorobi bacterium]|nr:MAG: hypothetical protein F9K28_00510 [Bacteroidota bacterium]KXK35730.1 MAG: hypothetical protein UZ06_CHB003000195 [Chlorobi bacterium OLB6]MBE2265307.1 hypothetical protein [Flavobacteriales bacterium]MBL1160230.1 hypothetical protein [Chlorobiota bacterium]MBW7853368.1 hypothetical protein [Candidatus Kapabacteria bacterium]MCC6330415.1 hypothetical protein [Ignavibacteria bacterium]